ncbi:c-type cytochrome [uncultured Hymenobacter sp.]|uniref:c-type cytochrome n=1 Tax=uncultured Hymenobacter sp. TaxID=170016 RepID=UPI0035CB38AD
MRKVTRVIGICVATVAVLVVALVLFISVRGVPNYTVPAVPAQEVAATPARLAQGEKLAVAMCADCHLNKTTQSLTGGLLNDLPPEFGKIYASNITQEPTHGVGQWTDAELIALLRTGIGRDGRYRLVMPQFVHMSDEDINSLVVFLRSNHAWVKPKTVATPPQEPSLLTKALTNTVMKPAPLPTKAIVAPSAANPVALGHYLVTARYLCYDCHSQNFQTNNALEPEKSEGYLGGGNEFITTDGSTITSRNLTMDPETGLGDWTEAEFTRAVKYGLSSRRPVRAPMPRFSVMSDEEAHAIFAYLQTVPRIKRPTSEAKGAVAAQ